MPLQRIPLVFGQSPSARGRRINTSSPGDVDNSNDDIPTAQEYHANVDMVNDLTGILGLFRRLGVTNSAGVYGGVGNWNVQYRSDNTFTLSIPQAIDACQFPTSLCMVHVARSDAGGDLPKDTSEAGDAGPSAPSPLRPACYFEVQPEVVGAHRASTPFFSIGFAKTGYCAAQVGWRDGSIGYHADDGGVFVDHGMPALSLSPWIVGSRAGAGVYLDDFTVFFTLNGHIVRNGPEKLPKFFEQDFLPTIGMNAASQNNPHVVARVFFPAIAATSMLFTLLGGATLKGASFDALLAEIRNRYGGSLQRIDEAARMHVGEVLPLAETALGEMTYEELTGIETKLEQSLASVRKHKMMLRRPLCIICCDKIPCIVALPCRHMLLCKQCFDLGHYKSCPLCNAALESTIEIYQ